MHVADVRSHGSFWYEEDGTFRLLGGSTLAPQCEPHFHETYSIAYVTTGEAHVRVRGIDMLIGPGTAILMNPFEIASCTGSDEFAYDICYPSIELMEEVGRRLGDATGVAPLFAFPMLSGDAVARLGAILRPFNGDTARATAHSVEEAIVRFLTDNPHLFAAKPLDTPKNGCALRAKDLIQKLIDQPLTVHEICRRLHTSRSYFVRSFSSDVGISPSWYIRQKRLSRGLAFLREGQPIADAAIGCGFSDQAHFTREFKRFYGTTPGKLIRDIAYRYRASPPT